ncbi:hypothetical protein LTR10_018887 [Elasticomyces elasticus]|uniref:Uncharacterized protein n=1 Tax=Exophiala sideris TaxID=1016849 RepID=A0ABR0JK84_9EURO|nr:hypothetical protein LTR10_018887 [Elasticomyces elasticus]KAK5034469.1 hypothetical protein LTS07_003390 [Exophiala sideris]KAK5042766.1 hypothetical protein LTR13_001614 [Exophiala sideris]KAK5065849.1 hypothetical protein LTR69_003399 [Exophiala sideris]KAK5185690.1 hypothetical protein LTR44_001739 [Eurotiomycetes sp. CCFEE 6388]
MMMVPRAFAQNPMEKRQTLDFHEKDTLDRRKPSRSPSRSALSQSLTQRKIDPQSPQSDPVKIPSRIERHSQSPPRRPAPSSLQPASSPSSTSLQELPKRRESAQQVLSSTTIPIRRKPKQRSAQRIPKGDYVADFSRLLRDDVPSSAEGSLSGSWTNPQFEGLFGAIDGLVEGQMFVGSEGVDAGILSARSLSTESMPSLASPESPDDFSTTDMTSFSPATLRSPSDLRLRQMANSEDVSNEHPLLSLEQEEEYSGDITPELSLSPTPTSKHKRRLMPEKRPSSFKSSLTASLKALKSAAQTMSNIASTPPLLQPDDFLSKSIFDFQPSLTDDRRPPPSEELPSAALRRYLNGNNFVPSDSPAQLHFWMDEKPTAQSKAVEAKPKLKIKRKYQKLAAAVGQDKEITGSRSPIAQLPNIVPLATCIPSSIRTAHASSPPTWLEPDGTPSNKHRAAQTLWENEDGLKAEGQPRPREPRENRDFLRVFVAEMNMRKSGKLSDDAIPHARLWLPPVDVGNNEQKKNVPKKVGVERWPSWVIDDGEN